MLTKEETKFKETEIGLIPEEWELKELGEVINVFNHKRIPLNSRDRAERHGKYPYYGASGIVDYVDDYIFDGEYILISEDGENLRSRKTPIAFRASGKFWVNNHAHIVKSEFDYTDTFLLGVFDNLDINSYITGAVQPKLNKENLLSIKIPHPPLKEQKSIAEILSSLDEKIELNRRMNKTLEEIGKTLFKRWFLDFEFPNEDGKPYKSSGGKMVDSELGEIPEGWTFGTLEDIADVSIGRTPPRKESIWFTENPWDIKWISIKDLGNSGVFVTSSSEYLTSEAVKKFKIPVIPNNTIVISFKLTVGRVAITVGEMLSNEAIAHVKLQSNYSRYNYFLYHYLKSFDYSSLGSTSSIATAVNSQSIKQLSCLVPEPLVIQKFNNLHAEHFELILSNTLQIENLISLRESLLPKLISGRIRTV